MSNQSTSEPYNTGYSGAPAPARSAAGRATGRSGSFCIRASHVPIEKIGPFGETEAPSKQPSTRQPSGSGKSSPVQSTSGRNDYQKSRSLNKRDDWEPCAPSASVSQATTLKPSSQFSGFSAHSAKAAPGRTLADLSKSNVSKLNEAYERSKARAPSHRHPR